MRSTAVFALWVAVLSMLLGGCGSYGFKASRTVQQSVAHVSGSSIEVSSKNGTITIVADASVSQVEVEATLTCRGGTQVEADSRLASTTVSISRGSDGTLAVQPIFPDKSSWGGDGASFLIRVPDANGVVVDTSNGAVKVSGLTGQLVVDTSNGRIEVTGHDGDARLDTSNGSITVKDLTGELVADTSNGNVSVGLTPNNAGPLRLDTSNGNVVVNVGKSFAGRVEFDTSNGSITYVDPTSRSDVSDLSRKGGSVQIGTSGGSSRVDTSNGNITFTVGG